MHYFVMFPKFEENEGQYKESGEKINLMNINSEPRLFHKKPITEVQKSYKERGFSDYLKCGGFFSASNEIHKIFFENGFQGVQFIPLLVKNDILHKGYSFVHKIATYNILDSIASEAEDFDDENGYFSSIFHLYLDKKKFHNANIVHDVFMCSNYFSEFICNERVKIAFEAVNITGIEFNPVEFSS